MVALHHYIVVVALGIFYLSQESICVMICTYKMMLHTSDFVHNISWEKTQVYLTRIPFGWTDMDDTKNQDLHTS